MRFLISNWNLQERARVYLVNNDTGNAIASEITDEVGYFEFDNISNNTNGYRAVACFNIEGIVYVGTIPVLYPPNNFASIFLTTPEVACPIN